ncbi:MAG TPA: hypothetical protein VFK78_05600 [Gemmatimonadales bacterium]|nr:hypothetical protein [Gemmatimonadales bacterium]
MAEHRISVKKSARYFTLGQPGRAVREVWVVLHGYAQLAERFLARFAALESPERLIVAPEALSRFYIEDGKHSKVGASWMTREDRLADIADYLAFLDQVQDEVRASLDGGRATLKVLGYSQGAATACRWTAMGKATVARLVIWGGEVPPDLDLRAARARLTVADLTLVYGASDDYFTSKVVKATEARLREAEIPFRPVSYEGGHELDDGVLREIVSRA